mmetsp:Transcript_33324/g.30284  ORF Transcript_33324/g.30284 Transcript_33324/m.30284 type:complete len:93 (+) Transcript_33324:84-362(+)
MTDTSDYRGNETDTDRKGDGQDENLNDRQEITSRNGESERDGGENHGGQRDPQETEEEKKQKLMIEKLINQNQRLKKEVKELAEGLHSVLEK